MDAGRIDLDMTGDGGTKEGLVIDGATGSVDPPIGKIDLANAVDVRREMAKVYREMRSKKIDPGDGTKYIYALTAIGKMIELSVFEERLAALEERQNAKRLTAP